jgi:curli biogenesis system outer membrane secretion channel CsgG
VVKLGGQNCLPNINNERKLIMNKPLSRFVIVTCCALGFAACQSTSNDKAATQTSAQYQGLKARVAVARFTDKSQDSYWWRKEIGEGMADQLTTELVKTNRFIVLERQALDAVLSEQDLVLSGRVNSRTGAGFGNIAGAELVIVAAVTEFDDASKGMKMGGSSFMSDMVNSVSAGFQSAHMAIDLRLVDTTTSQIIAATSIEGGTKDFSIGAAATNFGDSVLGGNLSGWSNTPKEKALREVIAKSVTYLIDQIPADYYRHDPKTLLVAKPRSTEVISESAANLQNQPQVTYQRQSVPNARMTISEKTELVNARSQLICLGYMKDNELYDEQDVSEVSYDQVTVDALQVYQAENGLATTARADRATLDSMAKKDCLMNAYQTGLASVANLFGLPSQSLQQPSASNNERVRPSEATRTQKNYGNITVKTISNASGLTEIRVITKHKDSGAELADTSGYLYSIENGRLDANGDRLEANRKEVVNSGVYYIKFAYADKFFTTGEVKILKGVENQVVLELE